MRVMELREPALISTNPLVSVERDPAAPGPGEIALRVTATAVCRTDLQLVTGDLEARRLPIVPGHQVVGHVTAVGEGVADWRVEYPCRGPRCGAGSRRVSASRPTRSFRCSRPS